MNVRRFALTLATCSLAAAGALLACSSDDTEPLASPDSGAEAIAVLDAGSSTERDDDAQTTAVPDADVQMDAEAATGSADADAAAMSLQAIAAEECTLFGATFPDASDDAAPYPGRMAVYCRIPDERYVDCPSNDGVSCAGIPEVQFANLAPSCVDVCQPDEFALYEPLDAAPPSLQGRCTSRVDPAGNAVTCCSCVFRC